MNEGSTTRKRLGILTYHYVTNDGAVLQAYALCILLTKIFPNYQVEIINYKPLNSCAKEIKGILFSRSISALVNKIKRYVNFNKFVKENLSLSKESLTTNRLEKAVCFLKDRYDVIVVGSDEIWKIEHGFLSRPFPNIYWLPGDLGCIRIAFAASANKVFFKNMPDDQRSWILSSLAKFCLIGVRDSHTLSLLHYLGFNDDERVYKVPDPTFILENEIRLPSPFFKKLQSQIAQPMVAVLLTNKKISKQICSFFRSKGYLSISLSYHNPFTDMSVNGMLNPIEWACSFKYFSFCVTDRFHGAIFCLTNSIPFVVVDDIYQYGDYDSKILDLLREFDIEDYYMSAHKDFNMEKFVNMVAKAQKHIERDDITMKVLRIREECLKFIDVMKGKL